MEAKKEFQEIFVRLKFSPELSVNKRNVAWRQVNFNKMYMKDVSVEDGEISFTSEFNAEFSKEYIKDFIENKSSITSGEGISVKFIPVEVIEIKEEAEIYSL